MDQEQLASEFQSAWDSAPIEMTFSGERRVAEYWWLRGRRMEVESTAAMMERLKETSEEVLAASAAL